MCQSSGNGKNGDFILNKFGFLSLKKNTHTHTKKQVHFEEGHGGEALEKHAFSQPKQISWGWFKYCVNIYIYIQIYMMLVNVGIIIYIYTHKDGPPK